MGQCLVGGGVLMKQCWGVGEDEMFLVLCWGMYLIGF